MEEQVEAKFERGLFLVGTQLYPGNYPQLSVLFPVEEALGGIFTNLISRKSSNGIQSRTGLYDLETQNNENASLIT